VPCGLFRRTRDLLFPVCLQDFIYCPSSDIFSSMESSPVAGNSFTNAHKDWKEGMYENFKDWSVRQYGHKEMESGDEVDVPVNFQKAKDIVFEKNR
jgi:hypothetical protein